MQRLEVSDAVRLIYKSLGVKGSSSRTTIFILLKWGGKTSPRYGMYCYNLTILTCINMPCCRLCFRLASRCFWSTACSRAILCSSRASTSASSFPDLRSCRCLLFRDWNTPQSTVNPLHKKCSILNYRSCYNSTTFFSAWHIS